MPGSNHNMCGVCNERNAIARKNSSMTSNRLALARRNTALFILFLYLQDVFWLIASRILFSIYDPVYNLSPLEWPIVFLFFVLAIAFSCLGAFSAFIVRPVPKIRVSRKFIISIVFSAVLINIVAAILLRENARYISGGLTGVAGIVYGFKNALTLAAFVLISRERQCDSPVSRVLIIAFIASYALTIDGLASALMLGMFLVIILDVRLVRPGNLIVFCILSLAVLWVGFNAKFSYVPYYLTPEFMVNWIVARFSIQAEQMYTYLSGNSIIGQIVSYSDLIFRAISNRFDLVLGNTFTLEYPRSVSEATFYDMQGSFSAGSSPGVLLSTAFMGPFFFIVPFFLSFLFMQYFYSVCEKITFLHLCAYSFIFKALHSNFSEYFTVISPTLLVAVVFLFACLITPKSTQTC